MPTNVRSGVAPSHLVSETQPVQPINAYTKTANARTDGLSSRMPTTRSQLLCLGFMGIQYEGGWQGDAAIRPEPTDHIRARLLTAGSPHQPPPPPARPVP